MRTAVFIIIVVNLGCIADSFPPFYECSSDANCAPNERCEPTTSTCVTRPSVDGTVSQDMRLTDATILADATASIPDMGSTLDMMTLDQGTILNPDSAVDANTNRVLDAQIPMDAEQTDATAEPDLTMEPDMMMPPAQNLLVDPSFEDDDDIWNIYGGASRVESPRQDGQWSVRMNRRTGAEQRVDGLLPNAQYRLSGWGLSRDDEPTLIGVKNHGSDQKTIRFDTDTFTQSSMLFTTGAGTRSAVIFVYKHEGNRAGFADNLELTYVGPADATPIWSDEFDGSGPLDSTRWGFETGFVRNEELQWYQPQNAFRENGYLVIEGRRERRANPNYEPNSTNWRTRREFIDYTAASVTTKAQFSFQYGRLVVRAKVTNQVGTWPAIWTLGTDCEWPSNGEVDVMENYGGNILANFAWGTNQRWRPRWDTVRKPVSDFDENWTDRFHIWELKWTENHMRIFLDGELLNEVDLNTTTNGNAACAGENPFRQPHYILLNLALGGNGGDVNETSFPTRYLIDYVRVYE